jgi:phosphatidate cytidylyltransferase
MTNELFKRVLSSIIILPIFIYIVAKGSFYFSILLIICFLISVYEWQKMDVSKILKLFGIFFLIFSFYTIYEIRNGFRDSYWPFLIIIFISVATDIGGYIFGKILKGPKLTKLSPNKTYAGVLGGYTFSIILYFAILETELVDKKYFISFFIFIFLISSISQFGDILVSYFKRLSKIKDTGNIIPGHGGLLDRIDGIIFAFPTSYLIVLIDYFNFFL